jgi:multiple sugar transport system ATP-binding protein
LFGLRPEHLSEASAASAPQTFEARVELVEPMGMDTLVYLSLGGAQVCARVGAAFAARAGARLQFAADTKHMHLIDEATGKVL